MPANVMTIEPMRCAPAAPRAHSARPCCMSVTTSAENVENVVSPPQKPVMTDKRHSAASAGRRENTMRTALVPALSAALIPAALAACSQQARQNAADERLRAIYTSEWKWRTDQLPDTEDSSRPVADRLPKVDPATQEMRLRYW